MPCRLMSCVWGMEAVRMLNKAGVSTDGSFAVVFLDADTVVVQNSDELFNCPGFCATLRHSERFNSGVMVITPSSRLFDNIMESIHVTNSYTGNVSLISCASLDSTSLSFARCPCGVFCVHSVTGIRSVTCVKLTVKFWLREVQYMFVAGSKCSHCARCFLSQSCYRYVASPSFGCAGVIRAS